MKKELILDNKYMAATYEDYITSLDEFKHIMKEHYTNLGIDKVEVEQFEELKKNIDLFFEKHIAERNILRDLTEKINEGDKFFIDAHFDVQDIYVDFYNGGIDEYDCNYKVNKCMEKNGIQFNEHHLDYLKNIANYAVQNPELDLTDVVEQTM